MAKIIITSAVFDRGDQELLAIMEDAGHEVHFSTYHPQRTPDELRGLLEGVSAAIVSVDPFTPKVIASASSLRVIARTGVGYDEIDVPAATRHGIVVLTTPGLNSNAVADTAMALLLAVVRDVVRNDKNMRTGGWRDPSRMGPEVWAKTLGIIGLGNIGKRVALRASGFGMRILACDIVQDPEFAERHGVTYVGKEQLLAESDFVSLHAPLNSETRNIIDAQAISLMKPSAYMVNTSRGGVVDEPALYQALVDRRIAGAGLDVFMNEPPVGSPFLALENVVLTPHLAGLSPEATKIVSHTCVRNVVAILNGEPPEVGMARNPEVLGL